MTLLTDLVRSAPTVDGFTVSILALLGSLITLFIIMRNNLKKK